MPVIYRQKSFSLLTPEQQKLKAEKDAWYQQESQKLSNPFYTKKKTVGVTPEEQTAFDAAHKALWDNYESRAIANGLYQEVTVQEQLAAAETALAETVTDVNSLREELGLKTLKII